MAQLLSKYLGVRAADLRRVGVFNARVGIDNRLFIDPSLVKAATTAEFAGARTKMEDYFGDVVTLLAASNGHDIAFEEARRRLIFRESAGTGLGYSKPGGRGSGIGRALAEELAKRGHEIVRLGIKDPLIFELIGLFQEKFGADRISDMTLAILRAEFFAFTARVVEELHISKVATFDVGGRKWSLPPDLKKGVPLLFMPTELLDRLPIALDRSDIEYVASFNARLRSVLNDLIRAAEKKKRKRRLTKSELRSAFFENPAALAELVKCYRERTPHPYDFDIDPFDLWDWPEIGKEIATSFPLHLKVAQPHDIKSLREVVQQIIEQFRKNIEENRLYELLYDDNGRPRREVYSQRLFFASADAYCDANNLDLSREVNAGHGPVDFKISTGRIRYLVEVKLSTNPNLVHGFEVQLPAYQRSEGTEEGGYLILRVDNDESAIAEVRELRDAARRRREQVPDLYVIDARPRPSATRMRN